MYGLGEIMEQKSLSDFLNLLVKTRESPERFQPQTTSGWAEI